MLEGKLNQITAKGGSKISSHSSKISLNHFVAVLKTKSPNLSVFNVIAFLKITSILNILNCSKLFPLSLSPYIMKDKILTSTVRLMTMAHLQ